MTNWLHHAARARKLVAEGGGVDAPDAMERAVAANVVVQLDNLRTHPCVAEAIAEGRLGIHGWVLRFRHRLRLGLQGPRSIVRAARRVSRRAANELIVAMSTDDQLRREIDLLGRMFGDVIRRFEGEAAFNLIEDVRRLARQFASGEPAAAEQLSQLLQSLSLEELRIVVRAFSTFLELANLAEDRQRVRTLRRREAESHPEPYRESILGRDRCAATAASLRPTDVQALLRSHFRRARVHGPSDRGQATIAALEDAGHSRTDERARFRTAAAG